MKHTISLIAIVGLGAFVGNMLNIGLRHAMYCKSIDPIEFMTFIAMDFQLLLMPTAVTVLPAWLGILFVFLKSDKKSESRKNWQIAFGVSR